MKTSLAQIMSLARQLRRFIITGLVNTVFAYLVYAAAILAYDLPYFWAVVWSYLVGVPFSYLTFRAFVFTEGDRSFRTFRKFLRTYVALFIANVILMFMLVTLWGWDSLLAQAVVIPVCAALSFVINRVFVFK
jgi:putative flippase GtrA